MAYQPLRDLGIYLKAGHHFLAASPVYLQVALHSRPADLSNYPFLYPPLTLPFFAALAMLPEIAVQATWVAGSIGLALVAMRTIGLKWRWACLALLWPPLFQGILVGNVSVPALALLAIAPRLGGGLVVAAVFKLYTGIAALWLVRSRRWLDLAAGIGVVLLVGLVTLPVTHIEAWRQWLDALRLYQVSQQNLDLLYGFGLARFVPLWIFLLLAVAAVLAALAASGKEGLARISSATIVASPSLWGHGLLVAVPSMLYLRPAWFWLGVAITSVPDGVQWWWLPALIVASWFIPALRRQPVEPAVQPRSDPMDPMADGASEPWPGIPVESAGPAWNFKIGRPGRVRPSGSVSEPE
jgi:hypothetical protein